MLSIENFISAIQNERDRIGSTKRSRKRTLPAHLRGSGSGGAGSVGGGSSPDGVFSDCSDDGPSPPRIALSGDGGVNNRQAAAAIAANDQTTAASRRLVEVLVDIENRLKTTQPVCLNFFCAYYQTL